MTKQHGNTGKRNALKSGRTKQLGSVRMTPVVYEYLKSRDHTAADEIERLMMAEIAQVDENTRVALEV